LGVCACAGFINPSQALTLRTRKLLMFE
jgi:hypothetical protein